MNTSNRSFRRSGYTLIELLVSSALGAVLLGGMGSAVYVASQAMDIDQGASAQRASNARIIDQILRDVRHATAFSERTATAITFTVPDRDGDGQPETMRYAWSGTPGDPLTYQLNGVSGDNLAADVTSLDFSFITRTMVAPVYGDETPTTGLVAQWMLDETSGTTAVDSSGNGHDGTHENGTTVGVAGRIDFGAEFNGTNNRVRIPDNSEFSAHTTTGLTVCGWVKVHAFNTDGNGQTRQPLISKGHSNDYEWALYVYDDGSAEFTVWQQNGSAHSAVVGGSIPVGQWVHVAGTHEPGVASRLYVNGILINSDTSFVGDTHDGTRDVFIAALESGQYLNATIDDVRIYNRDLTAAEVLAIHDEAPPLAEVVFESFAESQESSNTTSTTINLPTGTVEGELLIATVATDGETDASLAAPSGWTLLHREASSDDVSLAVWWKVATASEPTNYDFTWSGSEEAYGFIMRFSGQAASNPIHTFNSSTGSGSSPQTPAVTTTVDNCMILRIGGFDDDDVDADAGDAGDAGMTDHTTITMNESGSGNGTASGGAAYAMQATAGSSGTADFALTASEQYVTLTIAIAPETN